MSNRLRFEKIEFDKTDYCIIFSDGKIRHRWDGNLTNGIEEVINEILEEYENN